MSDHQVPAADIRAQIRDCVHHLEHLLPGQAPIRDFVHHNTLHGFQHLPFREALSEARRVTGNRGYLPPERFRAYLAEGRITREDLLAVIDAEADLDPQGILLQWPGDREPLPNRDLVLVALCHDCEPIAAAQLQWRIDEECALDALQGDLDPRARHWILASAGTTDERQATGALWSACVHALGLEHRSSHPEELTELSPEQVRRILGRAGHERDPDDGPAADRIIRQIRREASQRLHALLDRIGPELTLRGLLGELTGVDLMDLMRPPWCASSRASWTRASPRGAAQPPRSGSMRPGGRPPWAT